MESGQGMVAVVRGLGDSQLAVTVLDSGKQYTLLPTSVLQPTNQQNERCSSTNTPFQQYQQSQCHVAAQATDGQYATVYKTTHCKVRPTSPPVQLTEFPPQRAAVAPGEGNFEVGGTGSGDTTFNFVRTNGAYRGGGMVWPDRGCVCSPRASREPDAFADSLRKYPATISPERSAEIVERLINYTQSKNFAKVIRQSSLSPTRLTTEQTDRSPSRGSNRCKACDLEKTRFRFQGDSPTKDRPRKTERLDSDGESRRTFTKSFDVRYVRDMSRRFRDGIRNNPNMAQCPSIREAFEIMNDRSMGSHKSSHGGHSVVAPGNVASMPPLMVNSHTQAAASMACKEVSTESRHKMFNRNVAAPMSPSSEVSRPPEGGVFGPRPPLLQASVQTLVIPLPVTVIKSVQTTQSSIDISNVKTVQNTKKCMSEIELSNREVREKILRWLIDVFSCSYSKTLKEDVIEELKEKMKNVSNDYGGEEAKVILKVKSIDDNCCKDNLGDICDELVNKVRVKTRYLTQIYRAEVVPYKATEDLKKAIKDWLLELPMRTRDYSGKYADEEQMLANFVKRLKKALFCPDYDTKKLRNEIVKILQDIPIDCESTDQNVYLNRLANNLIKKLLNTNGYFNKHKTTKSEAKNKETNKKFHPNENEIRDLVRDEMIEFLDKFDIKINLERLQDIESNILRSIMEFLNSVHSNKDKRFINDVVHAVQGIGAFEHQALYFGNLLYDHLKELLTKVERNEQDQAKRLHMMTVLNSTVNETSANVKREKDNQNNLDNYIQQLTQQIDEWLAGLELEIPWSQDESFRQVVVNDLAEDIVDRHKYVQLNHNSGGTEKDELEYIKYLIFKWINKLVGDEHQETIEHAHELLRRVRSVPVPLLAKSNVNCNSKRIIANLEPSIPISYSASKNFQAFPVPIAGPSRIENPTATSVAPPNMGRFLENIRVPTTPATNNILNLKHLNNMYDDFVRKWVQAVPIIAYTEEETALAETMRVGLYNGIFQIVTKLRFQPQLLFNPFFYQDALGEELEELLSMLPQTPEFLKHKNQLKALMIEKTTELNELIKMISAPITFKERIVQKYRDYIPRLSTNLVKECPLRLYEELQILNIAEDFLLYKKYNEEDPLKAYMYRQKLVERIEELVTEMKKVHGTELKNINPEVYMNEVLEALQQVSLPSEEEMKAEADEILLGHAIEDWYMGLPLAHNDNLFEQLKRRHLRNALTKKIQNMEKSFIVSGNTPEYELRHEISRFLEQIPLGKDETMNINSMVEALVNKVKDIVILNPQVQALYNTSVNYSDFSENAALHSTNLQVPEGYRLVGPLPPCCAAGLDRILAQPGPSGVQVQTAGASSAIQNVTPELDRRASMIGGGPPLASQSFGQQSSGGLRQSSSPVEAKQQNLVVLPSPGETSQLQSNASKRQIFIEKGADKELPNTDDQLAPVAGLGLTTQNKKAQRRTSIDKSGHHSGSASGQRRPSMGESEYKTQNQSIDDEENIQILHVSGSASKHRKPSTYKLNYNTQNTGESSHSGSARGQRKPSMGMLGKNTQPDIPQKQSTAEDSRKRDERRLTCRDMFRNESESKSTQKVTPTKNTKNDDVQRQSSRDSLGFDTGSQSTPKKTKDSKNINGQQQTSRDTLEYDKEFQNSNKEIYMTEPREGQSQFSAQTVECSTTLCKVNGPSACKSPSQTRLCYCNKAHTEIDKTGENKCLCSKPIRLCSNTETMTETKTCLCKGNKVCLCRKSLVSADIGGQTNGQATQNVGGQSVSGAPEQIKYFQPQDLGYTDTQSTLDHTEYSVSGKPGQARYLQQQRPGTEYDYDRQMTQESSTLVSARSLGQEQGPYRQGDIQYDQTKIRNHVPGPRDDQITSGAVTENDGGIVSMGEQYERGKNQRPSSLTQRGSRRLSHRVSIMSPESQERLRLISEADITSTGQQDPSGVRNLNNVETYGAFEGGRPRSSSLRGQTLADPATIEQARDYLQEQGGDNSIPIRGSSTVPSQLSTPIQNFDPRLVSPLPGGLNNTTLNSMSTPQWITIPSGNDAGQELPITGMEAGYQVARNPCVCPPHLSMLSPEQVSMLSPQRTGINPNQMFAPSFSPEQMFNQMNSAGQSPPGMFFGPNGTLPSPSQFRQAPQNMSQPQQSGMRQLRQSSIGQPIQSGMGGISYQRHGNIGQPQQGWINQSQPSGVIQGRMSQPQRSGISQPLQSRISQPQRGTINQPRSVNVSQPLQGRVVQQNVSPGSLQDSRYSRYIPSGRPGTIGAVSHDFPQDGRHIVQMNQHEESALMQTIPPEYQVAQPDLGRQISMPNRTQHFQDSLLQGGPSDVVQRIQEERRRSMIEGNIQLMQEQNAADRTARASLQATFSDNVQLRQETIQGTPKEQAREIAQLRAAQDRSMDQIGADSMQRRQSQGRSLIPTIEENEPQNISVQTGSQRASWQIPRQHVIPPNVPQDGNIIVMGPNETGTNQASRSANQAIRRASQNPANQSIMWQTFGPDVTPQNAQDGIYHDMIQPGTRVSQANRFVLDEPIVLNNPSISADQASFQQAGPSPAIQDVVEQLSIGLQGQPTIYSSEQLSYQNDMLLTDHLSGQPVQVIQEPAYAPPVAFSTPQRPIPPGVPRRPAKRNKRRLRRKDDDSSDSEQRGKNGGGGGRLESDSDSDHGMRIRCRCYDRIRRLRRRNKMYEEECDIPCPYAHYYYSCF